MPMRPKGLDKTGGREKGTPNKRTKILENIFLEKDFCVVERIIELMTKLAPDKQADVLIDLLPYLYPKRRPETLIESEHEQSILQKGNSKQRIAAHLRMLAVLEPKKDLQEALEKTAEYFENARDLFSSAPTLDQRLEESSVGVRDNE